jgi:hypothetical protein
LDTHRQIVRTAMLGAEFDDRIAIRPNRLPIGLALFGVPMLRVNLLCYGSGTYGSQTRRWSGMDSDF